MRFPALGQIFLLSQYMSQSYTLTYRLIEDLNICSIFDLLLVHLSKHLQGEEIIMVLFSIYLHLFI